MNQQLVLIVENGMMNRKKVSDALKRDGYEVQFASDAESALTIFARTRPFFILVSLIMLKIDCRVFSRIIKNDKDTKDITIIGFSDAAQSKGCPYPPEFDDFINMNESSKGLIGKIRSCLDQKKK